MCLINSNIVEVENKEVKRNSDITYEERVKIEFNSYHTKLDNKLQFYVKHVIIFVL